MPQTLVTVEEYRFITNDQTTAASAVSARLEQSLKLIDEYLQRHLETNTYTESCEVWYTCEGSYAYPVNTPITSVPLDSTYIIDVNGRRLRGVVSDVVNAPVFGFPYSDTVYTTITYTGGFTHDTLPETLREIIAWGAVGLLRRSPGVPVGATDVRVGDVAVKYPSARGGLDVLIPGASTSLRAYKRKRVRG